ncbi:transporter [Photobacterium damselae subsp. damselae]|uniref:potassium channel family protein n=1 Tax=Photobacterium damselae TaxID=38293 RepID=UPI000D06728C|nr:potassium channel family protein [Photobacterium damselae]NVO62162.1 two pore domain potassium channel family protein [Photobacterium damselae subsp. damselae]PSB90981.1 transporter [Photobacterium damselae subsp. damselae]
MVVKKKITESNNFFYLTLALIGLLISASLVQVTTSDILEYVLEVFTILTFVVCLVSLRFDQNWYRFLVTLLACWIGAIVVKKFFSLQQIDIAMLALMFAFFFGTFKSIAKQVLFSGPVTFNKIVGSVALFLLLGLMWAILYLILLEFDPNSFTGMESMPWGDNFSNAAYFSFVTLTTLGYGDISPITPIAQVIVYLEAIVGVFYMAIVVSSLVSSNQSYVEKNNQGNKNG